jgi:hypothetical protein
MGERNGCHRARRRLRPVVDPQRRWRRTDPVDDRRSRSGQALAGVRSSPRMTSVSVDITAASSKAHTSTTTSSSSSQAVIV